jgi:heme/copper-type cytochrome/quinol oxidase subunit 3
VYELAHIAAGLIDLSFGVFLSYYALRALVALHESPEMLKTQRKIWLPILIGMIFLAISGLFHLVDHTFYSNPLTELLHEVALVAGLPFLAVAVFRYSRMQTEYNRMKREAVKKTERG